MLAEILHVISRILGRHNNKKYQKKFHELVTQIYANFKQEFEKQFNMTRAHPITSTYCYLTKSTD